MEGQAKDDGHSTVNGDLADSSVVRIALDYCFCQDDLTTDDTEHEESTQATTSMTVVVMLETLCRGVWAYVVEPKGASEEWVIEQAMARPLSSRKLERPTPTAAPQDAYTTSRAL